MRIRNFVLPVFCLAMIALSGCGGGGGSTEGVTPSATVGTDVTSTGSDATSGTGSTTTGGASLPAPTKGMLKMATSGAASTIAGIDVTVSLPAGVTVAANPVTGEVTNGVVTPSGVAAVTIPGTQNAITARFVPASSGAPGQLHIVMANVPGFSPGEFATVQFDLATGTTLPLINAFSVTSFLAKGLDGADLSGITVALASVGGI